MSRGRGPGAGSQTQEEGSGISNPGPLDFGSFAVFGHRDRGKEGLSRRQFYAEQAGVYQALAWRIALQAVIGNLLGTV